VTKEERGKKDDGCILSSGEGDEWRGLLEEGWMYVNAETPPGLPKIEELIWGRRTEIGMTTIGVLMGIAPSPICALPDGGRRGMGVDGTNPFFSSFTKKRSSYSGERCLRYNPNIASGGNMKRTLTIALLCAVLLCGCGAVTPFPTATPTFLPTVTVIPSAIPSPLPTATITPPLYPVKVFDLGNGLTLVESVAWEDAKSQGELLNDLLKPYQDDLGKVNDRYSMRAGNIKVEIFDNDQTTYELVVIKNETRIYEMPIAFMSGVPGFVDAWVFKSHWAIEVVTPFSQTSNRLCNLGMGGDVDIVIDGESMKQSKGYQAVFGFQTLAESPFYFYSSNCVYGISYNNVDISLKDFGYEEITYRNSWAGFDPDPVAYQNAVKFWVERGGKHYFVLVGTFSK
jgi:hypothetical protein